MASVYVLTGYGINADRELTAAFRKAGGEARELHVRRLIESPERMNEVGIVAFPGGFSFGDHLGSGVALAGLVRTHLHRQLSEFVSAGGLVIGICNGFQVLVKSGLLPNSDGSGRPTASLVENERGHFIDRWVALRTGAAAAASPWLRGLGGLTLPVRHGEGRFVFGTPDVRAQAAGQVALHYDADNPNGSVDDIAAMVDTTGRVLGLMPHPEAATDPQLFPGRRRSEPPGPLPALRLFENGLAAAPR